MSGGKNQGLIWKPRVITYKEMKAQLVKEHGDTFTNYMDKFKKSLLENKELDTRLFSIKVVEEAWGWMKDKSQPIILFYSSLYSPSVIMDNEISKVKSLITALDEARSEERRVGK